MTGSIFRRLILRPHRVLLLLEYRVVETLRVSKSSSKSDTGACVLLLPHVMARFRFYHRSEREVSQVSFSLSDLVHSLGPEFFQADGEESSSVALGSAQCFVKN